MDTRFITGPARFRRRGFHLHFSGLKQFRREASPTDLVRGANTSASVAVEVLVEEHIVFEVGTSREFLMIFQHGALPIFTF